MASKEVKKYGKVVAILNEKEYRKLEGLLKENLPKHIPIEIQRKGTKIELWSKYPIVMRKALEKSKEMLKKYGTDAMSKAVPYYEPRIGKAKKEKTKLQKIKKIKRKPKINKNG